MSEIKLSGETTTSTGDTKTFNYVKPQVTRRTTKVIEYPTFKAMPINKAFVEIQDTINNQKNIFGDLLTEGDLTILFGRSNVGKSFLSYQIAEAIARGRNVLNVMDITELRNHGETRYYNLNNETLLQKVLYVDFEATIEKDYIRYSTKDPKSTSKAKPYQFSENFITAFPDRLTVADNLLFIDSIEFEVKKSGAKVVIIDNLSAISQDNEKSGAAVKLMNKIKDLQRRNKLTVLLMAHTPKIVQGEPIIWTNLAGSSNLYNLADSVMAINTTTMADDIRYIKQLKSRYNEIQYHKDNVVAIKFSTRPDGLKGFEFLNYEPEDELIKPQDKATKADEDREIINLIRNFDYTVALIAEELKPKFGADVELSTYYQRIKKRIQRLKSKGLIEDRETEPQPVVLPIVNVVPEAPKVNVAPEVNPRFKPEIRAILDEQQNREDAENLQAFTELLADIKNRSNTTAI
ncbi:MAG: AAA family ATPase [Bacteroidota bacterium]